MSKADFLRLLERALAQLSEEERQKNLEYYSCLLYTSSRSTATGS